MPFNVRIVSTYPPRRCGIGTFSRDLANALTNFTGEIGHIRISAIDKDRLSYAIPVDLIIEQYNPKSWQYARHVIITRARESNNPTFILLQHEYGLDPDDQGNACRGKNFVQMAKAFKENGLTCIVYLHTVLSEPDEHQKTVIKDLADYSDGLIVTTESAIDILAGPAYGIDPEKIKHIDHGIRMQHPSHFDRLTIKEQSGLYDHFLITTLGLLSPGKGIEYGIRAYGRFIKESCTAAQRKKIVYLIAGQCHPEFVKADGGKFYNEYMRDINSTLEDSKLKWCRVREMGTTDFDEYDVVFLENFLDEMMLMRLYGATNVMLLPYLNMEQMSSGILADTLGAGRVAVATKFRYALELINSNQTCPPGMVIGRYKRGVLVDPGPDSVEQMAYAIDYLVFHKSQRLVMERQAHQRGYQMRWNNSAWSLIQYVEFVTEQKEIKTGRGPTFKREKSSIYQRIKLNPRKSAEESAE